MFAGVDGSQPAVQHAQEHLPAARRLRLPGRTPRRSSAAASGCSPASSASGAATCSRTASPRRPPSALTTNAFGAPIPRDIRTALLTTPDPGAGGQHPGPADGPRADTSRSSTRTPGSRSSCAGRSASSASCRATSRSRPPTWATTGYDIEINRNINALPNRYLNADNSRTAGHGRQQHVPDRRRWPNPFRGLLPGTGFNNATIARSQLLRPFPAFGDINTTNNDGKSLVPLRPVQPAEALLERIHPGRRLHLLAVDAGHGVPERGRRGADPDDLGPGRAAPAVGQRHLRPALREGPAVPVERGRDRGRPARRLAGPGRLHLPDRLPDHLRNSAPPRRRPHRRLLQRRRHRAAVRPARHRAAGSTRTPSRRC